MQYLHCGCFRVRRYRQTFDRQAYDLWAGQPVRVPPAEVWLDCDKLPSSSFAAALTLSHRHPSKAGREHLQSAEHLQSKRLPSASIPVHQRSSAQHAETTHEPNRLREYKRPQRSAPPMLPSRECPQHIDATTNEAKAIDRLN
jgi:hypothetical protein